MSLGHSLRISYLEELQTVYPFLSFPLALQASQPCLFWEDLLALADQKPLIIENYAICNERNVHMQRITTLETQQVLLFCDEMHSGTCKHYKNGCVSRTTQITQLSLSIQHKLRDLLLHLTTVTINIDRTSTWKMLDFRFNIKKVCI